MTAVEANGCTLGVEHFGGAAARLVLCAGGTPMSLGPIRSASPSRAAVVTSCGMTCAVPPWAAPGRERWIRGGQVAVDPGEAEWAATA